MPFDPAKPAYHSEILSAELRSQFVVLLDISGVNDIARKSMGNTHGDKVFKKMKKFIKKGYTLPLEHPITD